MYINLILAPSISYYISYTDLICSLFNQTLFDPGSTLICVGAYGPKPTVYYNPDILPKNGLFL